MVHYYYNNRFGWVRFFGYGISWKDITVHGLTFSERNKYQSYIKISSWIITFLNK